MEIADVGQAKAKIDLVSGQIELEGSEEFVSKHLTLVERLIASRISTAPDRAANSVQTSASTFEVTGTTSNDHSENSRTDNPKEKSGERKRTISAKRSGGVGYPTRIAKLRDDGFFAERRDIATICSELSRRGFPNKTQAVGAALHSLVKSNKIERTKDNGQWQYLWPSDRS